MLELSPNEDTILTSDLDVQKSKTSKTVEYDQRWLLLSPNV
jgi:hypothetical protein